MDHRMPFQAWGVASIVRGLKFSTLRPVTARNSRLYRCDTGEDWQIDPRDCYDWRTHPTVPLICHGGLGEALQVHPRIQPGDRLLVCEPICLGSDCWVRYESDGERVGQDILDEWRWKASRLAGMYLPTDLVRYAVTVESVEPRMSASELTDEEIMREGIYRDANGQWRWHGSTKWYDTPRASFEELLTGINGPGSFDVRTPLWLYGFGKVEEVTR